MGWERCFYDVVKFRISRLAERYSVTGVTAKSVGWAREREPAPHFILFSRKKVAICLLISLKMCNFAAVIKKKGKK